MAFDEVIFDEMIFDEMIFDEQSNPPYSMWEESQQFNE
jgi:hypothetical protein